MSVFIVIRQKLLKAESASIQVVDGNGDERMPLKWDVVLRLPGHVTVKTRSSRWWTGQNSCKTEQ